MLALGVGAGPDGLEPGRGTAQAAVRYGIDFAATAERAGFKGAAAETLVLELPVLHSERSAWAELANTVILVGTGAGSPDDLRQAGAKLARAARGRGKVTVSWGGETEAGTTALVEGYLLGAYQPVRYGQASGRDTNLDDAVRRDWLDRRVRSVEGRAARGQVAAGQAGTGQAARGQQPQGQPGATGSAAATSAPTGDLTLLGAYDRAAIARAEVLARATALARDLGNWPSNWKTPAAFVERAAAVAAAPVAANSPGSRRAQAAGPGTTILTATVAPAQAASAARATSTAKATGAAQAPARQSVEVTVLGPDELAALGLNAILAVGEGAWRGPTADPDASPRLLLAAHTPIGVKGAPHIVIVGKGVTFDSGGLDLKPTKGMAAMKTDMAGGATALAVVMAAAELALPAKVTAVVPLAQNSIGAASYRPSDVVTVFGGTTVEVGDTDAEGRLVLADALAYAAAILRPDYLIDVATLTGAAKVAFGLRTGALATTDGTLAARIERAGRAHGEDWWRLPLAEDYGEALETPNADLSSTAKDGVGAGAITAALFLQRFAGACRWAHLDVAGPARAATGQDWTAPGATGFGVRTLVALVERLA
jgi:leucyl aminopeptidase